MQSAQRKRLEQEEHSVVPGVTSRSAGDWFVEPGARTPDTLPDPLAIDPNYFADPADMTCMIRAVRLTREIGAQPALEAWNGGEFFPGVDIESDEAIARYVRAGVSTWFHPAGTCRMGSGSDAVVDARLRVRGITGLRVADASIMPELVGVNTNASATMIGWHAGELMLRG